MKRFGMFEKNPETKYEKCKKILERRWELKALSEDKRQEESLKILILLHEALEEIHPKERSEQAREFGRIIFNEDIFFRRAILNQNYFRICGIIEMYIREDEINNRHYEASHTYLLSIVEEGLAQNGWILVGDKNKDKWKQEDSKLLKEDKGLFFEVLKRCFKL